MSKIKTTPEVETPAAPAVPIPEIVAGLRQSVIEMAGSLKRAGEAKVDIIVKALEFKEAGAEKADIRQALGAAIAEAYGVKENKVTNSPKNGGDKTLYPLLSELMGVVFAKEDNAPKRDKAIKEKRSWQDIVQYARNGTIRAAAKQQKEHEPLTLEKFSDKVAALLVTVKTEGNLDPENVWNVLEETYEATFNPEEAEGAESEVPEPAEA